MDLSHLKSVKFVYFLGECKSKIACNPKTTRIYLSDLSPGPNTEQIVQDFESRANKSKTLSYNFSSGSTGPPKIMIYKNQVPRKFLCPNTTTVSSRQEVLKYKETLNKGL